MAAMYLYSGTDSVVSSVNTTCSHYGDCLISKLLHIHHLWYYQINMLVFVRVPAKHEEIILWGIWEPGPGCRRTFSRRMIGPRYIWIMQLSQVSNHCSHLFKSITIQLKVEGVCTTECRIHTYILAFKNGRCIILMM